MLNLGEKEFGKLALKTTQELIENAAEYCENKLKRSHYLNKFKIEYIKKYILDDSICFKFYTTTIDFVDIQDIEDEFYGYDICSWVFRDNILSVFISFKWNEW